MTKGGSAYIMANRHRTTLYVGVTSDLRARVHQHQHKHNPRSFTARYNVNRLVYYETFDSIEAAIEREKQLKAGSRTKKIALIESNNPHWKDLTDELW